MSPFRQKFKLGFTFLELLLVIAIISVISGLVIFNLRPSDSLKNANTSKNIVNSKDVERAIQLYSMDHDGVFPPVFTPLVTGLYDLCLPNHVSCSAQSIDAKILIDEGYLSEIPVVPGCQSASSTCYKVNYNAERLSVKLENGILNPEPAFSGYDWSVATTLVQPSTTYNGKHLSIAKKTNGKLILVNLSGNIIYESEVNDVPTLLSGNNTASVWTDSGIVNTTLMGITVFNVGNELFMSVHDKGLASSFPATLKLFKSPSGNGGDWVLHSVVNSLSFTGTYWTIGQNTAMSGTITVLENGTWIMPGVNFDIYSTSYIRSKIGIYTSNDSGVTWTYITWFGEGINAGGATYYTGDMPKNIIQTSSGNLYTVTIKDYGGLYVYIRKSTDNGITWTRDLSLDTMDNPPISPFEQWDADVAIIENGLGGFYILTGKYGNFGTGNFVYEFSDPDNDINNIVEVKTLPRLGSTNSDHASVVSIDGYMIITRGSYVTGVPEL